MGDLYSCINPNMRVDYVGSLKIYINTRVDWVSNLYSGINTNKRVDM